MVYKSKSQEPREYVDSLDADKFDPTDPNFCPTLIPDKDVDPNTPPEVIAARRHSKDLADRFAHDPTLDEMDNDAD
ncbi:hypothetical protein GOV12_00450 [Candidatus Pacearchaeota archaeon]|nr:hypothetical protein [Candidatus Pacearchaeota archaeon]